MACQLAFVLASILASVAAHDEIEETDTFALLQSQVEEIRAKHDDSIALAVEPDEYNLQSRIHCEAEPEGKAESVGLATIVPLEAAGPLEKQAALEEVSDDPAGASTARSVLHLLTLFIILDGFRRLRHQQQDQHKTIDGKVAHIERVAKMPSSEAESKEMWLPMVKAAQAGDEDAFKKALCASSLTHADAWGCTTLHFAAEGGSATICKLISTELSKMGRISQIDALDAGDETPLHIAARAGHADACEVLLAAGANMEAVNKEGMTPLVIAGSASQASTCRLLADHGGGVAGMSDEELPPLVVSQVVRKMFAA